MTRQFFAEPHASLSRIEHSISRPWKRGKFAIMFFVGAAVLLFALGYAFFYQSGDLFIWTDEARLAVHPPSALIEKFSTEAMVLGTAGVVSFAFGIAALIFALFLACERVTFTISHSKEFLDPRNAKT